MARCEKTATSFAEAIAALTRARQEYFDALAGHSEASSVLSSPDAGYADGSAAIRKANVRLDAASVAYAKALRDYRAFKQRN
jgi:hypothetical protein